MPRSPRPRTRKKWPAAVTALMSSGAALVGAISWLSLSRSLTNWVEELWAGPKPNRSCFRSGSRSAGTWPPLARFSVCAPFGNARVSLFARAVSALLLVACVAPGLATGASATGLAWLMTAAVWSSVIVWWTAFLSALDRESHVVFEGV